MSPKKVSPGNAVGGDEFQDPHAPAQSPESSLEAAIGTQVREFRQKLDMTVVELAKVAGLSAGMLSKIEHGLTSPSLGTLQNLAKALHVPVTALFRRFEEERKLRRSVGKRVYPMPEKFLGALQDMPAAAGNALGIDRLVMLLADAAEIDEVVAFTPEEL